MFVHCRHRRWHVYSKTGANGRLAIISRIWIICLYCIATKHVLGVKLVQDIATKHVLGVKSVQDINTPDKTITAVVGSINLGSIR